MILDDEEVHESYTQGFIDGLNAMAEKTHFTYLAMLACTLIILAALFGGVFIIDVIKIFNH